MKMDDQRHIDEYNEVRKVCICRGNIYCSIPIPEKSFQPLAIKVDYQRVCKPDDHKNCPLFTFIKGMPVIYND